MIEDVAARSTLSRVVVHLALAATLALRACSDDVAPAPPSWTASTVRVGEVPQPRIARWTRGSGSHPVLVVFEAGLGDDHQVWTTLAERVEADVLVYDRAGYGASEAGAAPRDIAALSAELEGVVADVAIDRKVLLVGHSLGGMVIRDFAIRRPAVVAGLLFVDASHEDYNQPTEAQEDLIVAALADAYGEDSGPAQEAEQLIEDSNYMATLPSLPDVPVIAVTSMRVDATHDAADRARWYASKEALRAGVTDFEHVTTTDAGHYLMREAPDLVLAQLEKLLAKAR